MNLIRCLLTNNDCYKAGKKIVPKGIMVHSTGANNPNLKRYVQPNVSGIGTNTNGNDWNRAGIKKCVHAFIGKLANGSIATVQTLPWNHRGWHCGDDGNNTHISFEICEDGLTDKTYFNKVYQEAVELCVYLCKEYNLTEKDIICHSEGAQRGIASSHADLMHWFPKHGKDMDDFRNDVAAALKPKLYRVQVGAFSKKAYAENLLNELKAKGYSAYIKYDGKYYRVQVGAFSKKANATKMANELKAQGYSVLIKEE